MPTATATILTTESFVETTFDRGIFDVSLTSFTSTQINVSSDIFAGRTTIVRGTNFAFDSNEDPTSGTVTSFEYYQNGQLIASLTGVSFSLVNFVAALDADEAGNPAPLDALFAPYDLVQDASAVSSDEYDFDDSFLPLGDTAIAGAGGSYMSLGEGSDNYVGGTGWDQISFASEDGGTGVVVDLLAGTATDTWGNSETISGTIEALRGTQYDDTMSGNNNFNMMRGLEGDDVLDGRGGGNEVRYDRDASYGGNFGVTVNLTTGTATDGFGDTDTLSNFTDVRGSQFSDTLIGDAEDNKLRGNEGDDILNGLAGDDNIEGGDGNDSINGGDGSDYINGDDGNDTINPGDNNSWDTLVGSQGNDTYVFSDVNTSNAFIGMDYGSFTTGITFTINGSANNATINKGAAGTDTITDVTNPLDAGSNIGGFGIGGSSANDVFNVTNDASFTQWMQIHGGVGNDTFNITSGIVRLDYSSGQSGIDVDLSSGDVFNDGLGGSDTVNGTVWEVRGSDFNDIIDGSAADESFISRGGNDDIDGDAGFDRIRYDRNGVDAVTVNLTTGTATGTWNGNAFTDTLAGIEAVRGSRQGDDTITGNDDFNRLQGRGGDDTFYATIGNDQIEGEDGEDTVRFDTTQFAGGALTNLDMNLGDGTGTFDFGGNSHTVALQSIENATGADGSDDMIEGSGEDNVLSGLGGADTFSGFGGNDTFDGGDGQDTVSYAGASGGVNVYLQYSGKNVGSGEGRDVFVDIENLTGSNFADRLIGDAGDNVFRGASGDDVIKGKGGNDSYFGEAGDDRMRGDAGIDIMDGGADGDILLGLAGNDMLDGGTGDDFLYGGLDSDTLNGEDGADVLRGNRGGDRLNGGDGDDDLRGGGNGDIINGDADDDYILGEGGADFLNGGAGNDTLLGGFGSGNFDGLRDTFIYADTASGSGGFDRIRDFENNIDVIDLTAFGFGSFADVSALASDSGASMRINFGGGDVIFIDNFSTADFDASDVILS